MGIFLVIFGIIPLFLIFIFYCLVMAFDIAGWKLKSRWTIILSGVFMAWPLLFLYQTVGQVFFLVSAGLLTGWFVLSAKVLEKKLEHNLARMLDIIITLILLTISCGFIFYYTIDGAMAITISSLYNLSIAIVINVAINAFIAFVVSLVKKKKFKEVRVPYISVMLLPVLVTMSNLFNMIVGGW